MSQAATATSSATGTKWAGLGYQQVPGLANRLISRYLRGQRRNMLRFFTERGMFDLAERMRQIRASRQGMLAKNRMFQKVLNDYSTRVTPKAAPLVDSTNGTVGLPDSRSLIGSSMESVNSGPGTNPAVGLSEVAGADGASGIVIEE